MGLTEINGLPAHALLVHVVVVLVPLAALALVAAALLPAARRRLGVLTPGLAIVALLSVPLTTSSGEWLSQRVEMTTQTAVHIGLADGLLPWTAGMAVLAVVVWLRDPRRRKGDEPAGGRGVPTRLVVTAAVAVLAVVVSAGSVVQVYRIGDAGARAVWTTGG